jgi:hypothetical protein
MKLLFTQSEDALQAWRDIEQGGIAAKGMHHAWMQYDYSKGVCLHCILLRSHSRPTASFKYMPLTAKEL